MSQTMLPSAAREALTTHLVDVRRMHDDDLARGFGRVVLPFALDRKFPNASTKWRWQFVFPAGRICRDPRYGPPIVGWAGFLLESVSILGLTRGSGDATRPRLTRGFAGDS